MLPVFPRERLHVYVSWLVKPWLRRFVTAVCIEWYVELFMFPEMFALLYCGFATMKFSGSPPFRSMPPTTPVKLEFVFKYVATPARLPFAILARVLEKRRSAEEPLSP